MKKEIAAGAVIFRREGAEIKYLLIYSGRNGIWGFPKGHLEPGESEAQAAAREIEEETGLTGLTLLPGFRREDVYEVPKPEGTIEKHSVYYVAETRETEITVDNGEITDYRWTGLDEALALLPFEGIRAILRDADAFLKQMS